MSGTIQEETARQELESMISQAARKRRLRVNARVDSVVISKGCPLCSVLQAALDNDQCHCYIEDALGPHDSAVADLHLRIERGGTTYELPDECALLTLLPWRRTGGSMSDVEQVGLAAILAVLEGVELCLAKLDDATWLDAERMRAWALNTMAATADAMSLRRLNDDSN